MGAVLLGDRLQWVFFGVRATKKKTKEIAMDESAAL
jgi:hypothetical protein